MFYCISNTCRILSICYYFNSKDSTSLTFGHGTVVYYEYSKLFPYCTNACFYVKIGFSWETFDHIHEKSWLYRETVALFF